MDQEGIFVKAFTDGISHNLFIDKNCPSFQVFQLIPFAKHLFYRFIFMGESVNGLTIAPKTPCFLHMENGVDQIVLKRNETILIFS